MTGNAIKRVMYFLKYLKPYWQKEVLVWILSFGMIGFSLIQPYIAKLIIDKAYAQKNFGLFIKLLVLGGLIFIVSYLINSLSSYLREYIDIKVRFDLERAVFNKIENLPFCFFQGRTSGEYIYKTIFESSQVASFITGFLRDLFYIIPKFLLTLAIVLTMSWKMALFIFVIAPFLYIPSFFLARKMRKQSEKLLASSQNIIEIARETFSNFQLVKVFGKEKAEKRRFLGQAINSIRTNMSIFKLNTLGSFLDNGANSLLLGLITLYSGYNIIKGSLTLGSFTAIMIYISQLLGLQSSLINFFTHRLIAGTASVYRFSEILESWPSEQEDKNAKEFLLLSGEIEFRDVNFGYYPNKPVLEHLSFRINGGQAIGLVGNSGRGKTTLINLIVKLYSINEGSILLDNQDINLIRNKSLRDQIGVVLQKPVLWNDTIKNNILYGRPKAGSEEILRATRISCAHDFIKDLRQGYDTKVDEGGIRLSEGQRQRIGLARAIIKNPKILIIDEGMSSLDSQTEDKIINNIRGDLKNITLIVVSHRLSTIKKMDIVYFLESADKITIGYHDELVRLNSNYRELFASQIEEERVNIKP